jgi:hypothetical protein
MQSGISSREGIVTRLGQEFPISVSHGDGKAFAFIILPFAALSFIVVHLVCRLTLPVPWVDETWFMIPALNVAHHLTPTADQMLVHQIYWMPANFYIPYALMSILTGSSNIHALRALSFICVLGATFFYRSALSALLPQSSKFRIIGHSLAAAWFFSLPTVFAADIVRPEAVSLLFSSGTLALALRERNCGSLALAIVCVVTHPLEAVPSLLVAAIVFPEIRPKDVSWWEWLLLTSAAGLLCIEAQRIIWHFDQYKIQMLFQAARKLGRHIHGTTYVIGALSILASGLFVAKRRHGQLSRNSATNKRLLSLAYALLAAFVFSFGQEMWYFPWATVALTIIAAVLLSWYYEWSITHPPRPLSTGYLAFNRSILSVLLISAGLATWLPAFRSRGVYGFTGSPPKLREVIRDQASLKVQIFRAFREMHMSRVLLTPSLYAAYRDNSFDAGSPRIFSWVEFSQPGTGKFDHLILLTRGYPQATRDTGIPPFLANQSCRVEAKISTPNYDASVIRLSPPADLGSSVNCSEIQPR